MVTVPQPWDPRQPQQQGQSEDGLAAQLAATGAAGQGQPAPGDLQEVNQLSMADALVWYTRHGYAARPAAPDAKMLTLRRGYSFDQLGVLTEQELATTYASWQQRPAQRVALIMGVASGLVTVDVDDLAEWERFRAEHGSMLPNTALQVTGRDGGGFQLLYHRNGIDPELLRQGPWSDDFLHIELKSKGLIIAAPSVHASGRPYQWLQGPGRPALISTDLLAGFAEGRERERAMAREISQQIEADGRPQMPAGNPADFADALCAQLGGGHFTGVYQRDNKLVMVPRFGEDGYVPVKGAEKDERLNSPAQIVLFTEKGLRGFVSSRAWTWRYVKVDKDTYRKDHALPPLDGCSAALHADPARWTAVPVLAGVVHIPLLRPDGTLLATPGYDKATGLLYLPLPGQAPVVVPEHPALEDAQAAGQRLWTLFRQFGWVSTPDSLNYLAAVLVPPLRLLLPPPWPLWVINAHERGSGKTLLAEMLRILHGGILYAAPGEDAEETRKAIGSILGTTTGSVVLLDNAEGVMRSRHFAALLTNPSGMWHDRKLGTPTTPGLPNDREWVLTGNNVRLGGDIPRRALWCSIDPGMPEPWLRPASTFTIPDLAGHVKANRSAILADILVLGRFWVLEKCPPGRTARGDSFAAFAAGMSGLMESARLGQPGQFWAESTNQAADGADDDDVTGLLAAVHEKWGSEVWTARQLVDACTDGTGEGGRWQAAVFTPDILPGDLAVKLAVRGRDDGGGVAKSLGWWLRDHKGQWTSSRHRVVQAGGGKNKRTAKWMVQHSPR